MSQFGLKSFKLSLCIFVVSFKLCNFFQIFQSLLAETVVFEIAVDDHLLEVFKLSISKLEISHRRWGRMCLTVFGTIADEYIIIGEIIDDVLHRIVFHFHIGHDAFTALHQTAVLSPIDRTVSSSAFLTARLFTFLLIINLLNTASAWDIVFGCGQFQVTIVW